MWASEWGVGCEGFVKSLVGCVMGVWRCVGVGGGMLGGVAGKKNAMKGEAR